MPYPLADVPTPALLVDLDRVDANVARAQAYADANDVALRPHTKTHKSPRFAQQQLHAGARGVCVAKLGEAELMVDSGIGDVFMPHTIATSDKAARAVALAQRARFAIGADHPRQLEVLSAAAAGRGRALDVMIEVDTGSGRGGADPEAVQSLLTQLRDLPGLRARGLYTYEGYTYAAGDVASLRSRHHEAQGVMARLAERVADLLVDHPEISMGSTPSLLAQVPLLPTITEVRPGTSIFLDAAQATIGGEADWCAAHVLATVVSVQSGRAVLDAGSKALTSDTRPDGVAASPGFGRLVDHDLTITSLSEEHGVIRDGRADRLEVGARVRVLMNHVCPVVNLFSHMHLVRGGEVVEVLEVAGRGRVV
ncbi:MAG: alanine racemase [Trueperaceae bacterium]|nr:alanine racemase [Trueperaceae bacterium]